MRHDKDSFAQEAIKAAHIGKLIGDYTRILLFSSYARLINEDVSKTKDLIDPFTGCFVSKIPITVVYLRFALKAASLFDSEELSPAVEFIQNGSARISQTLKFIKNDIDKVCRKEKKGWKLFYETLNACRSALKEEDPFVSEMQKKVQTLSRKWLVVERKA